MEGHVIRSTGLQCLVLAEGKTWLCKLRGRLKEGTRRTSAPVVAGDRVQIGQAKEGNAVVEAVLPRVSKISRVASGPRPFEQILVANIDRILIIAAVKSPQVRAGFIDRALVIAHKNNIVPVLCFNKVDLGVSKEVAMLAQLYEELEYRVLFTSTKTAAGISSLKEILGTRISALIGQSGVGKSSLINCIDPHLDLKTQDMMQKHDRGRHTTTVVQLHPLAGGGFVVDTPGIKGLEPWDLSLDDLDQAYLEIHPFTNACKFRDCMHRHEPECAVLQAVHDEKIDAGRYQSYQRMRSELAANQAYE